MGYLEDVWDYYPSEGVHEKRVEDGLLRAQRKGREVMLMFLGNEYSTDELIDVLIGDEKRQYCVVVIQNGEISPAGTPPKNLIKYSGLISGLPAQIRFPLGDYVKMYGGRRTDGKT